MKPARDKSKPAHKSKSASSAAQKRRRSGATLQQTEEPEIQEKADTRVEVGEQPKLDYISRPNHVWITHLTEELVKTPALQISSQSLYLTAYNGSVARTKVRVQGLSQYGEICFEHDVQINSGWTRILVDPRSALFPAGGYREPFPVTFVIASEVDVVLTGVFDTSSANALGPDMASQAKHQLEFTRADCTSSSFAIPCALPLQRPWSQDIPWDN
jgi:hypothetical protein